jgi:hypothetical protein
MKNLLLIIAITVSTILHGQGINDFKPNFQVGISFAPNICYRSLKNNDGSASSEFVIDSRNTSETPKIGFSTGLNIFYNINPRAGLELGVQYSNKGYRHDFPRGIPGGQIDPKNGFDTTGVQDLLITGIRYDYQYLDIPIKFNYLLGKGKIKLMVGAGIVANIFIKQTSTIFYQENGVALKKSQTNTFFKYKPLVLSALVSAGIDWELNTMTHFRAEPTFQHGLTNIIDHPVTGNLFTLGCNFGLFRNF